MALTSTVPTAAQELSWALQLTNGPQIELHACLEAGSLHEVVEHVVQDPDTGQPLTQKIPGRLTYNDLVCGRALSSDTELAAWRHMVTEGGVDSARTSGCLQLLDSTGTALALWDVDNAWPAQLRVDLQPAVPQESLVLAHEGLRRVEGIPTVAVDDAYETAIDTQLTVAASGVLGNDTSSRCGGLFAKLVSTPLPSEATVSLAGDGSLTLTPAAGFTGIVSFAYEACTAIECDQATVEVGVGVPVPVDLQSFTVASLENTDGAR